MAAFVCKQTCMWRSVTYLFIFDSRSFCRWRRCSHQIELVHSQFINKRTIERERWIKIEFQFVSGCSLCSCSVVHAYINYSGCSNDRRKCIRMHDGLMYTNSKHMQLLNAFVLIENIRVAAAVTGSHTIANRNTNISHLRHATQWRTRECIVDKLKLFETLAPASGNLSRNVRCAFKWWESWSDRPSLMSAIR